ncbi:heavy-metal-associated domain-containing protein [Cellulosimicrobium arenosum]|uniref:Heavy-metal-associated domain-containing protein n=1 Tax=Cellulosimicrobium arenosum TaxID=2708133 RepID=A0A927J0K6_9MICO|nr:heavy metal-associated domain-containing protein [Cellulosimicrobium arenosum]MBD8079646.1 heavy-metal-associated domain-containing protein [Cellulosimicrobium arenosum]
MSTVTTVGVTGMTCANCVSHVTTAVESVDGVENVSIELRVGEASEVTVFSDDPLDEAALRGAIAEAGYEVATIEVQQDALATQYREQSAEKQAAHDLSIHTEG